MFVNILQVFFLIQFLEIELLDQDVSHSATFKHSHIEIRGGLPLHKTAGQTSKWPT